jgi:DNA-binding CsgD family transcriptional regulator
MVGRDREIDALRRLVGLSERPAVALVAGEAGVGKTRLVEELAASVGPDVTVLVGQADPGGLAQPFGLLLDALGPPPALGEGPDDVAEGSPLAEALDPTVALEARVRAGAQVLAERLDGGPAVVVFEDLHWADTESASLMARLAESATTPVLLVGTYRPDALSRRHPAADLLARLERRSSVTHLRLDRLDASAVDRFLAATLEVDPSFRVVDALHARTGGNPFFLEELLAAAPEDDPESLASQPLPWSLSEAVLSQLDGLDEQQRCVLEAASVLGRRVHFDVLAAVTGLSEVELIGSLRALVAHGVLVEAERDLFGFRHELAREAVSGQLLGREHRRLHEAALDALLAAADPDPTAVARHAQVAGRYDILLDAARRGSAAQLEAGSTHSALQLAELGLSEGDDPELLGTAARAAWLAGLLVEARAHAERWVELVSGDASTDQVDALGLLARIAWELDDEVGTSRWLLRLRDVVTDLDGEPRARALAAMAQLHMLTERNEAAVDWAAQAIELATELGLDEVRVAAGVERGSARVRVGPDTAGIHELVEAADEASRLGFPMLEARALNNLLWVDLLGPRPLVLDRLERMRAAAQRIGFETLSTSAYQEARSWIAAADGDLVEARRWAEEQARDVCCGPLLRTIWYGSLSAALLAVEAGDGDRAEQLLDETDTSEALPGLLLHARTVTAAIHAFAGRADRARQSLEQALETPPTELCSSDATFVLYLAGGLRHAGIDPTALLAHLRAAGTRDGWPLPATSLLGRYVDGILAEEAGDVTTAADRFAAVADPEGRSMPGVPGPIAGSAAVAAGRLAVAAGDLDGARAHAEAAVGRLARWGGWRVAELAALQRRLGVGADLAGPEVLTPREREVVALLGEGLTNAELAERLYISPRTAGVHVSNVLAKLSMANRAEVAAWAVREGLAG